MENSLSITEIRLIEKSLTKLSDYEVAELLDKPIDVVSDKIAELTGISKKVSYSQGNKQKKELKAQAKATQLKALEKKKSVKLLQKKLDDQYNEVMRSRKQQRIAQEQAKAQRKLAESKPMFQTKQVDYSQMVAVRIDHTTIVYAKPGQDINKLKQSFRKAITSTTDNYRFKK